MGRIRVSRHSWARAGLLAGGTSFAVGIGLTVDFAAALMAAGVEMMAYCLLVADVGGDSR